MNGARAVNVLSSFTVITELEIPSSSNLKHKVSQNKKKICREKKYAGKTARKQKHTQEKVGRWGKAVLEH